MRTLAPEFSYPTLQHPDRHVWDFWYHFDPDTEIFHLFYLNADRSLVAQDQHHLSSQVGYATTKDFLTIEWVSDRVLGADPHGWDDTSIWSGDIIKVQGGFLMFYTSRNQATDDGMTQNVGVAFTHHIQSFDRWFRIPSIRIQPDAPYELHHVPEDLTINAWRDPFLFRHEEQIYMLLSAKDPNQPVGKKGAVALLKAKNNSFEQWEYLPPICQPGFYAEMEVPQLYRSGVDDYALVYSTWAKYDFAPTTEQSGGLQGFNSSSLFHFPAAAPKILLPETANLYACRIIPELNGEIVGFDITTGGIRRSGVQTGLKHVDRDFSSYSIEV
jgi:sucrose-6-phosphate hydrolase SacC (GH32 family)